MKRRILIALAVVIPLAIFFVAPQAASWRPQLMAAGELSTRIATPKHQLRYDSLSETEKVWVRSARTQGWRLRAVAPDDKRLLAQRSRCDPTCGGAILGADEGQVIRRLRSSELASKAFQHWADAAFSLDGTLLTIAQSDARATLVFDARTGTQLWSTIHQVESVRFSPDGSYAAFPDASGKTLVVVEARTKRELKRLPYKGKGGGWGFSRDGDYLLAEAAPGRFAQLRLR